MTDMPRHDAPQPAADGPRHTLSVREVEVLLADAGVQRSHRHVLRLCQSGMLDAVKIPGGPSGEEWFVSPESVPKAIGDLKQIETQRARRSLLWPAMAGHDAVELPRKPYEDRAGHAAPEPAASQTKNLDKSDETQPATARHGAPDIDIYNHPYVLKLEERNEKLEAKYEAQVRRTEEIQLKSQAQLIELQRMVQVGQSQTLSEFFLKAKDWMFKAPSIDGKDSDTSTQQGVWSYPHDG